MPKYLKYLNPERDHTSIARVKRLTRLVADEPRFKQLPNFESRLAALSQVPKNNQQLLTRRVVNDHKAYGQTAALIAAGLSRIKDSDLSDPSKRAQYRTLRTAQIAHRELVSKGGQAKVSPSGGDKRRYNPTGKSYAVNKYGVLASLVTNPVMSSSWVQMFRNPNSVLPCIQRSKRREVMFAIRKAGKGYKVKHRRSWSTGVPC